jgi:hypothetical protein
MEDAKTWNQNYLPILSRRIDAHRTSKLDSFKKSTITTKNNGKIAKDPKCKPIMRNKKQQQSTTTLSNLQNLFHYESLRKDEFLLHYYTILLAHTNVASQWHSLQ